VSVVEMVSVLVGFFLPAFIAVVVQTSWRSELKGVVAFLACAVAGGATAYLGGALTGKGVGEAVVLVLFAGLGAYKLFWHPSGLAGLIERKSNVA